MCDVVITVLIQVNRDCITSNISITNIFIEYLVYLLHETLNDWGVELYIINQDYRKPSKDPKLISNS
jgi:hypothetical protein